MRKQRWQHLDLDPSAQSAKTAPTIEPTVPKAEAQPSPISPALLTQARGYYHLRHYHAAIEALDYAGVTSDREAARLLGLSLGYVHDPRAPGVLEAASALAPSDLDLQASLLSAQLRTGVIPSQLSRAPTGAFAELTAAALWLRGRKELGRSSAAAAGSFTRATALFAKESPADVRSVRVGASYIGAAVSHLHAGDYDAAQNAFASHAKGASPELRAFANTLHAIAEELRGSAEAERTEAVSPLIELVTSTQLHVGFFGTPGPVDLQWSGSDLAALTGYRR